MFFTRLAASIQYLRPCQRSFSSTAPVDAYKMKSHSGAKKRFRSISSGVFKRGHSSHAHLNTLKRPSRLNRLGGTAYTTSSQTAKIKKKLLPYGSK